MTGYWPYAFAILAVLLPAGGLVLFAYLDRMYRELGRVSAGPLHENVEKFETEIEPRLGVERRRGALAFSLLAHVWLALVAIQAARYVTFFVPRTWEALLQHTIFVGALVGLAMHLIPYILVARTHGRWLIPLLPVIRIFMLIVWPLRASIEMLTSLMHITEQPPNAAQAQQEQLEALVEAAEEEGIIKREEAHLIEQVVEFSDKRVRDVMTPRPEIVAIPATATIEQLRRLLVETKFSRIPAYEGSVDEIVGIVFVRDILQIPESEAPRRTVREVLRPVLFVPETKLGSQLLKEMQQKRHQMAVVIDEYGSVAGLVTMEDLVEEIVGEIAEEDRAPLPEVVRESDGSLLLRGSVTMDKLRELVGIELEETDATTVAGLLNSLAGHVPAPGEVIEHDGLRFEVLEANQRKVLRLRARRNPAPAAASAQ